MNADVGFELFRLAMIVSAGLLGFGAMIWAGDFNKTKVD